MYVPAKMRRDEMSILEGANLNLGPSRTKEQEKSTCPTDQTHFATPNLKGDYASIFP